MQAEFTNILIDGCLFEKCYSSKKGGGMHQGIGQITVLDSVFFNNTAGSNNKKAGEAFVYLITYQTLPPPPFCYFSLRRAPRRSHETMVYEQV